MAVAAEQHTASDSHGHFSLSGLSFLMALGLAAWEIFFFWGAGRDPAAFNGPFGIFSPDRLGFNMAWLVYIYLAFQLISIPFALSYREQFIGVLDGLASVVPL